MELQGKSTESVRERTAKGGCKFVATVAEDDCKILCNNNVEVRRVLEGVPENARRRVFNYTI